MSIIRRERVGASFIENISSVSFPFCSQVICVCWRLKRIREFTIPIRYRYAHYRVDIRYAHYGVDIRYAHYRVYLHSFKEFARSAYGKGPSLVVSWAASYEQVKARHNPSSGACDDSFAVLGLNLPTQISALYT